MSDDGQVKSYIDRVQRLQEEKRTIEDDIKEVYAGARGNGYDVKVLRAVVKHLGKDQDEVAEFDAVFDLYLQAYEQAGRIVASRAHVARDAGARTRGTVQRQSPSEGEIGNAVRTGAQVSKIADPVNQPSVQSEAEAGESPEQGSTARAGREGECICPAHVDQFVTPTGEGEGVLDPSVDPSPAAEAKAFKLPQPKPLRPNCLKPEQCSGYGSVTCFTCRQAAEARDADEDGAEAPAFLRKTHDHAAGERA